jgi:hypothetical protein
MPALAPRYLWHEGNEEKWEKLYSKWLVAWDGDEYMQWEHGDIQPGLGMNERAQKWLEDADELGLLFMSIGESSSIRHYLILRLTFLLFLVNAVEREPRFELFYL